MKKGLLSFVKRFSGLHLPMNIQVSFKMVVLCQDLCFRCAIFVFYPSFNVVWAFITSFIAKWEDWWLLGVVNAWIKCFHVTVTILPLLLFPEVWSQEPILLISNRPRWLYFCGICLFNTKTRLSVSFAFILSYNSPNEINIYQAGSWVVVL